MEMRAYYLKSYDDPSGYVEDFYAESFQKELAGVEDIYKEITGKK